MCNILHAESRFFDRVKASYNKGLYNYLEVLLNIVNFGPLFSILMDSDSVHSFLTADFDAFFRFPKYFYKMINEVFQNKFYQ